MSGVVEVHDQCGQGLCMGEATHRMFWPGHTPTLVCSDHKAKAEGIAQAMGFGLHFEPIANPTAMRLDP